MTTGDQPGYGHDPSAPWTAPPPPTYAPPYGPQPYGPPYGQQSYAPPYAQQPYGYAPYGYAPAQTTNTLAIVSFVASVANLVLCGVGSIVGLICGFIALRQIKQRNEGGRGLAIAGIIISAVFLLLALVGVLIFVIAVGSSRTTPG